MTFKKQSVIFYVLLVVCVAAAVVCVSLGFNVELQYRLILLGGRLKGASLNHELWLGFIPKAFLLAALLFLTVPLCFFKFDRYVVKEKISTNLKRWDMTFGEYVRSYTTFVQGNPFLLFFVQIVLLVCYGTRLSNDILSMDTVSHYEQNYWIWMMQLGRFGYSLLQRIFHPFGFNLYFCVVFAIIFLLFGTLAWCHLVDLLLPSTRKYALYVFAAFFATSTTWCEQVYYTFQSAETIFIVLVCPFAVYFLFTGILNGKHLYIVLSAFILSLCVAVYQAVVLLFFAGILMCFLCYTEDAEKNSDEKTRWMLALKLAVMFVATLVVYFALNKIVLLVSGFPKVSYFSTAYLARVGNPLLNMVKFIFGFFSQNPVQTVFFIASLPLYSCIIRQYKSASRIVAFLLMIASCCVFGVLLGGISYRLEYALPLTIAFISFFLLRSFSNPVRTPYLAVVTVLCFLGLAEVSMLNWTELRRYEQDKAIAQDLALRIAALDEPDVIRNTPILLYGAFPSYLNGGSLIRTVFGRSMFAIGHDDIIDTTQWGIALMNDNSFLGFDFIGFKQVANGFNYPYQRTEADVRLIMKAREAAETMPDYPSAGCVQNLGDVIVVRLSETTYQPEE